MSPRPWEKAGPPPGLLSLLSGGGTLQPERRQAPKGQTPSANSAIEEFRAANPIVEWLEARLGGTRLERVGATNGGEWSGPCPACGGDDRLRVWPNPREGNPRAWCRQCERSGDVLDWTAHLRGRDPKQRGAIGEVLRGAGLQPVEVARPVARRVEATPAKAAERAKDGRPESRCYCCGGREFMRVSTGPCWVCATCHPPLPFVQVLERWTVGGGA